MRRREQDGNSGDYGKCGENNQTKSIDNHCSKLPVRFYFIFFIHCFQSVCHKPHLFEDAFEFSVGRGAGTGDVDVAGVDMVHVRTVIRIVLLVKSI